MSITYTITTNFGDKDTLPTGDSDKVIKGSQFTTEFTSIKTAFGLCAPAASPAFTGTISYNGTNITSTAAELNALDGFTGTVADLNYAAALNATGVTTTEFDKLDGLTATTAELNILDGLTTTTAELNTLDGFTGTVADLNYAAALNATGVTSTEFDKLDGLAATTSELNKLSGATVTTTEINYNDITTLGTVEANKAVTAAASAINFNNFDMTNVDINSGTIDGATIGASSHTTGKFTTLQATGALTLGAEVTETVAALTQSGANLTIDPAGGTVRTLTLSESITSVTSNLATGESMTIRIDDGASAYGITWPTMTWIGGSAPDLATTGYTWVVLFNVGGTLYGVYAGDSA